MELRPTNFDIEFLGHHSFSRKLVFEKVIILKLAICPTKNLQNTTVYLVSKVLTEDDNFAQAKTTKRRCYVVSIR